ncbi:MAG: hypothetical protein AAF728_00175 [Cyanobacteria bacterium P01_D01_bin.128]
MDSLQVRYEYRPRHQTLDSRTPTLNSAIALTLAFTVALLPTLTFYRPANYISIREITVPNLKAQTESDPRDPKDSAASSDSLLGENSGGMNVVNAVRRWINGRRK